MGTLDKEVRLSFAKRIRETLPEVYQVLIPSSRDNDIPEFKYSLEETPYSEEGKAILTLFKKKAPETDVQSQIESIREKEQIRLGEETTANDSNLALIAGVDSYVTALSHIGSKSLSHALSFIERHKDALLTFGSTSERLQVQIIDSVVAYWRNTQPAVAVNLIDKLLNYTIVSPSSVIQWALSDPARLNAGRNLSDSWLFEMVSGTMGKITRRMQQIIAARNKADLPEPHAAQLDETLQREAGDTRSLFRMVEDALQGVAEGAIDVMIEEGVASDEELAFLKMWGRKWIRVFKRKRVIEEVVLSEAVKSFPPPVEETAVMEGVATNGGTADMVESTADGDAPAEEPELVIADADDGAGAEQANGENGFE